MPRHNNNNNNNMIVQKNEKDCRNIYGRAIFVTTTIYLGITGLSVRTPRYKNVSENRSDYKSNRAPRRECFLLHPPPSPSAASLTCTPGAAGRLRTPSPSQMTFFFFSFFILLFMHAVAYLFRSCLPIYFSSSSSSDDTLYCYIRPPPPGKSWWTKLIRFDYTKK